MSLDELRRRIDAIDSEIVRLLGERASCAARIGEEKKRKGLPLVDAAREADVRTHVRGMRAAPLTPDQVNSIYDAVIRECARLQERGPEPGRP